MVAQPVTQVGHDDHNLPMDCVLCGDSLDVLSRFPDNCIDAIVCDPPAGINFMNKPFDDDRGGRDAWIAWLAAIMKEALRCLRPGGHALVWALPRTSHWTAMALEDSGFEVREKLYHLFGSGFPKSMSLDKAIDKHLKAEREVIGHGTSGKILRANGQNERPYQQGKDRIKHDITTPATPEAQQWAGWGTATKPAVEEWILCRKPLSEKSIAENCLKWNCGALNIDGCRIQSAGNEPNARANKKPIDHTPHTPSSWDTINNNDGWNGSQGRFPSNLLLSHSVWCVPQGTKRVRGDGHKGQPIKHHGSDFWQNGADEAMTLRYTDPDGYEEVEDYLCDESCPIAELDRQGGYRKTGDHKPHINRSNAPSGFNKNKSAIVTSERKGDEGLVSRYFSCFSPDIEVPFLYSSKASRRERNAGCEGLPEVERHTQGRDVVHWIDRHDGKGKVPVNARIQPAANDHPTVKSLSLMRWLVKLVGVPGGVILDPFCGSGSTLVACVYEGLHFIGIDQDQHYVNITEARIVHAQQETGRREPQGEEEYICHPSCPIKILEQQSKGTRAERSSGGHKRHNTDNFTTSVWRLPGQESSGYDDSKGGAARFFQQLPPDSLFSDEEVT